MQGAGPTTGGALALYCFLSNAGYQVHVINPIQSDAVRNLYIRKSKTDQKDAFILADLLRMNRTEETMLASEAILKLQTLSRTRFAFVEQVSGLKSRVIGILDRIFPEYEGCFSDVFIKTSRELLKNYSSPDEIAEMDLTELTDFLSKHSRGRLGMSQAEQIQNYAKGTFGIGLATVKQSGQFEGSRNRMSKRGSSDLRRALWLAAISAYRFNPEFAAYYASKRKEGKHHKVVIGAIARRLVHLIYSVWSQERPFESDYQWTPPGSEN